MKYHALLFYFIFGINIFAADASGKSNLMPKQDNEDSLAVECPAKLDKYKKINEIPNSFLGEWQSQAQAKRKFIIDKKSIRNVDTKDNSVGNDSINEIYLMSETQIAVTLNNKTIRILRIFTDGMISNKFANGRDISTIAFKKN
jgi:hypothetical protein